MSKKKHGSSGHHDEAAPKRKRHRHVPTAEESREQAEAAERRTQAQRQAQLEAERKTAEKAANYADNGRLYAANLPLIANALGAWHTSMPNPVTAETVSNPLLQAAYITSGFGPRDIGGEASKNHWGSDLIPLVKSANPVPVYAALSGKVIFADKFDNKIGEAIIIEGDDGKIYTYGHLEAGSSARVQVNQRVAQKQEIGIMGDTGNVTGKCLHFTVRTPPTRDSLFDRLNDADRTEPGKKAGGMDLKKFVSAELAAGRAVTVESIMAAMPAYPAEPVPVTREYVLERVERLATVADKKLPYPNQQIPYPLALDMNQWLSEQLKNGRAVTYDTVLRAMQTNLYEHKPVEPVIESVIARKYATIPAASATRAALAGSQPALSSSAGIMRAESEMALPAPLSEQDRLIKEAFKAFTDRHGPLPAIGVQPQADKGGDLSPLDSRTGPATESAATPSSLPGRTVTIANPVARALDRK